MECIQVSHDARITTLTLSRGKVNALDEALVDELTAALKDAESDDDTGAVILTGSGKFFSFGFDIPAFYDHSPEDFTRFIIKFTDLYTAIYLHPKPIVAALNGHAVAGGCMLSNSCDYRIMAQGKGKVALNELAFGSTVFAGSVAILRALVGQRNAETILYTGDMFTSEQALALGLTDETAAPGALLARARVVAESYARQHPPAFAGIKRLLRQPVIAAAQERERPSIEEFIRIWYSDTLRHNLKGIHIHS